MEARLPRLGQVSLAAKAQLALVAFGVARALLELRFPLSGGDALRKWMWARLMYHGWSPSKAIWGGWDHHASRLALNVPALASQYLLGDAPWVYYVVPLCLGSLSLVLVFRLASRLGSLAFAFWATLLYAWFLPIRHTTQLMPDGLSTPYVLASTLCVVKVAEAEGSRRRVLWALAGGLCMMLAELTKEPNLFFVPGLMLGLWLTTRSRLLPFVFAGSVSLLMLLEFWIYRISFNDYPLGRFSVIADKHLGNARISQSLSSGWELFTRLGPTFSGFWGIQLALFLGVAALCLPRLRRLPAALAIMLLACLGFLLLHAFGVRGLDPLLTWQRPLPRYVVVSYPFTWLTLGWAVSQLGRLGWLAKLRLGSPRLAYAALALLLLYSFATRFPGVEAHPLTQLSRMARLAQAAEAEGLPVVAQHRRKYAVQSFQALFWNGFEQPHYVKRRKLYPLRNVRWRGKHLWWLVDPAREQVNLRGARRAFRKWRAQNREVLLVAHGRELEMKRVRFGDL